MRPLALLALVVATRGIPPLLVVWGSARADTKPPETPLAAQARREAGEVLEAWLDAQNQGDFPHYRSLYDERFFKGVKRTARGSVKRFDHAGWMADRERMFKHPVQVVAYDVTFQTWLDRGSKLKDGVTTLRFVQRWKSERYADHGVKLLQLWRERPGKQLIVYEDLLNSTPGWDEKDPVAATLSLQPPRTDEEALVAWARLAPTGADHVQKLAGLPDDARVRRPLARAILGAGGFACQAYVDESPCGERMLEWETLDPKSTWDDPCLRRRLALWALEEGRLTEKDVTQLLPNLEEMMTFPEVERELPEAILALVRGMGEPLRLRLLRAAVAAKRVELANKSLDGLSHRALVQVYRDHHLDAAARELDPEPDRALLLEAIADDQLATATLYQLIEKVAALRGDDARAALARASDELDDCGLSMAAALALEAGGDRSRLPRRPDGGEVQTLGRALCRLVHDPDLKRRRTRWREFLPPQGRVLWLREVDDPFAERDESGAREQAPPEKRQISRRTSTNEDLDEAIGAGGTPRCDASSCTVETSSGTYGTYTVKFAFGKDGKLYIEEIRDYVVRGCGC